MTTVVVDLAVATVDGATAPAKGTIYVAPATRLRDGSHVIIRQEYAQVLVDGVASLEMTPGVYQFREDIPEGGGVTQVLRVPDTDTVNYGDLVAA